MLIWMHRITKTPSESWDFTGLCKRLTSLLFLFFVYLWIFLRWEHLFIKQLWKISCVSTHFPPALFLKIKCVPFVYVCRQSDKMLISNATRPILFPPIHNCCILFSFFSFFKIRLSFSDVSSEGQDEIMLEERGCWLMSGCLNKSMGEENRETAGWSVQFTSWSQAKATKRSN